MPNERTDSTRKSSEFPMRKYGTLRAMRYMGIDYGTKRVGIALSDESGAMAFPHTVFPNTDELLVKLQTLISDEDVGAVVIGHSLNTDNEANTVQEGIDALMLDLTLATGLPVHLEPEQYTTQEALRVQGRNEKTDASAAAIILNSYLSKQ